MEKEKITVRKLLEEKGRDFNLTLAAGESGLDKEIKHFEVRRAGLTLVGFFEHFPSGEIQVFGKTELSYFLKQTKKAQKEILKKFIVYDIPCVIITRGLEVPPEFTRAINSGNIPLLRTSAHTAKLIGDLTLFLEEKFCLRASLHGVLVDVYGVVVLIVGESGVGKSETALELVKRGHRLIADDVIEIKKKADGTLLGEGVALFRHHMEIRGLGIIDVLSLFGIGAVRDNGQIQLVVSLEDWDPLKEYDRLGFEEKTFDVLGVAIPHLIIPVKPGRNTAIIIEVAAMNWRLKKRGYIPIRELDQKIIEQMKKNE